MTFLSVPPMILWLIANLDDENIFLSSVPFLSLCFQWSCHMIVLQFSQEGAICVDFIIHSHIQSHQHHFSNTISSKCMLLTFSTGKASM